ncbi:Voltage-dependent calcium channel gamma-1 subunit [Operophtera brumata]|uniref:Voltage-dependent calcium channel gamma-1 subunit n=1 Tax=Operophtera brumata TaxID=104452 RepID=A0A0L7L6S5_OPEBR|nr:Voltage-dependent calcium channel gamma-1 subunit [Operophtera brumata]
MQALVLERRTLFACTVLVGLCCFVWLAAVCIYLPVKGRYLLYSDSGVWEICRYVFQPNVTSSMTDKNATMPRQDIVGLTGQYFTTPSVFAHSVNPLTPAFYNIKLFSFAAQNY